MAATSFRKVVQDVCRVFDGKSNAADQRTAMLLVLAVLCAVMPLDTTSLVMLLVGAMTYALVQPYSRPDLAKAKLGKGAGLEPPKKHMDFPKKYTPSAMHGGSTRPAPAERSDVRGRFARPSVSSATPGCLTRTLTVKPVAPIVMKAETWKAQVDELVEQLAPTAAGDLAVQQLVSRVRRVVEQIAPEATVAGFTPGAMVRNRAFAVAVPDVDIVISCPMKVLGPCLQAAGTRARPTTDRHSLLKCCLRGFVDALVARGDFKFRRSAFASEDPKVTVMPACLENQVPVDLSVNSSAPFHNAALLAECARLDPRARALALVVRRWARDRGISHAAKGHFSPYAWTLLTIYFLQVGLDEEDGGDARLPAFEGLKLDAETPTTYPHSTGSGGKSVAELFERFIIFYDTKFDFHCEAVSVRTGKRAPPNAILALHRFYSKDDKQTKVGPSIEDPFDAQRNIGGNMDADGFARFREELVRARGMLAAGDATVITVFETWAPPAGEDGDMS